MAVAMSDERKAIYQKTYSHLLDVLQEKPDQWMTRREMAAALGKSQFNSGSVYGMECLESAGLIETRRVFARYRFWEYRIKS